MVTDQGPTSAQGSAEQGLATDQDSETGQPAPKLTMLGDAGDNCVDGICLVPEA